MRLSNFYAGTEFNAEDFLGTHKIQDDTYVFRTFAPAAQSIVLKLEDASVPMHKIEDGNFWEAQAKVKPGDAYTYAIDHAGNTVDHADPYGFAMELRPAHRSRIVSLDDYTWHDATWMKQRSNAADKPMNIYEIQLGSWRKKSGDKESQDPRDWYTYEELAEPLTKYLTETGYNFVEFMPLNEYPFDGSWGYQPTGFFAPTSRFGTPKQLMKLIDTLHQANIGCILDIVPVHFAKDSYGLADYDGTALFEYPNDAVGISEWGSHNFMYSRGESRSFMQSSANFWLKTYHFDGLRMDAISRIIYWQGDENRGVNNDNVKFICTMNAALKQLNPGSFLVAEDSTNYEGITKPTDEGGLGFDYKWDLGWMHDTLSFMQTDPYFRAGNYNKLSFSMMYFWNERYLLPLSHDENVHGKATTAQKMWGDYDRKFPQARTLYLYMMIHPGKKLNFMGSEIAQLREWDEDREQDWFLRKYPIHDAFYHYCCELNHLYLTLAAFWDQDYEQAGFKWLDVDSKTRVCYAIERTSKRGERVAALMNFSGAAQKDYRVPLKNAKSISVLLDTDWQRFNGATPQGKTDITYNEKTQEIACTLPAFGSILISIK
ncbi:1,4-alpha-glucan branching protein GlgB [Atopobium sp. oral taxon 416]|uniref:1,4-alpha-glucan branching protein GlgB n=1 Tax=Atopobium sp. oral taxon 416 TaxID=712157 RepID=UPI001BA884EA|nr:1,4-alpha-glucan branching protein GlgB [Atopobium sp. oral taxon 416]QUC03914.1 1,4-alpha-glucan branching protein GlgB [Atopobium sp. oral taxon 416]